MGERPPIKFCGGEEEEEEEDGGGLPPALLLLVLLDPVSPYPKGLRGEGLVSVEEVQGPEEDIMVGCWGGSPTSGRGPVTPARAVMGEDKAPPPLLLVLPPPPTPPPALLLVVLLALPWSE